jgi:hypothetical protein
MRFTKKKKKKKKFPVKIKGNEERGGIPYRVLASRNPGS